jgi:hypothetical protein
MDVLTPTKPKRVQPKRQEMPEPKKPFNGLWLLLLLGVGIFFATDFGDFVQKKSDGTYELSPEREAELKRRKEQYDNAEQYVLVATVNGWYPCYNCNGETKIYLYIGEVWKYGISKNGIKRYSRDFYSNYKVRYIIQYEGTLTDCMKKELDQIYNYPLLPENLKRDKKLSRPPGNKEDY